MKREAETERKRYPLKKVSKTKKKPTRKSLKLNKNRATLKSICSDTLNCKNEAIIIIVLRFVYRQINKTGLFFFITTLVFNCF